MPYQHDVFISYQRNSWSLWVGQFRKDLMSCLEQDFGNDATVFIDVETPISVNYVDHLAAALARSKIMIALFSRAYFRSDWCVHELDLMRERRGAVFPVVIHDGAFIPDAIDQINRVDFTDYAIPVLAGDATFHAQYWKELKSLSQDVATAVDSAPNFDRRWEDRFAKRFHRIFQNSKKKRRMQPKTFSLKPDSPQTTQPRLRI